MIRAALLVASFAAVDGACTSFTGVVYPNCELSATACKLLGDGFCDMLESDGHNVPTCGFDDGDCCPQTCKRSNEWSCGARGHRSFDCKTGLSECPITTNKAEMDGGGGIQLESGYVKAMNIPCKIEKAVIEKCENCEYPYVVKSGHAWLNANVNSQSLDLESGDSRAARYRWIPFHSCEAKGCTKYHWRQLNPDSGDFSGQSGCKFQGSIINTPGVLLMCQEPLLGQCGCDDSCTRYYDCCYDYQWTCGASRGITGYLPELNPDRRGLNTGKNESYWATGLSRYSSTCSKTQGTN